MKRLFTPTLLTLTVIGSVGTAIGQDSNIQEYKNKHGQTVSVVQPSQFSVSPPMSEWEEVSDELKPLSERHEVINHKPRPQYKENAPEEFFVRHSCNQRVRQHAQAHHLFRCSMDMWSARKKKTSRMAKRRALYS